MNRFAHALDAATNPDQPTLLELAKQFALAVEQTEAEGQRAEEDPAVLVLGSFVGFHCHLDVNSATGYQTLLRLCNDRLINSETLQ